MNIGKSAGKSLLDMLPNVITELEMLTNVDIIVVIV